MLTFKHGKDTFFIKMLVCFILLLVLLFSPYRINLTSSMPIGLYKKMSSKTLHHGDLVMVCLPEYFSEYALEHGILKSGRCTFGTTPMLKEVIAIAGDTMHISDKVMVVNDKSYVAPVQKRDHDGLPLKTFVVKGRYQNTHKVWLYGSDSPIYSFDSRYFGGLDKECVMSVVRPILVFHANKVRKRVGVKVGYSVPHTILHFSTLKPAHKAPQHVR